jgi:hypothetical protein
MEVSPVMAAADELAEALPEVIRPRAMEVSPVMAATDELAEALPAWAEVRLLVAAASREAVETDEETSARTGVRTGALHSERACCLHMLRCARVFLPPLSACSNTRCARSPRLHARLFGAGVPVLREVSTGTQPPPCEEALLAFDALLAGNSGDFDVLDAWMDQADAHARTKVAMANMALAAVRMLPALAHAQSKVPALA